MDLLILAEGGGASIALEGASTADTFSAKTVKITQSAGGTISYSLDPGLDISRAFIANIDEAGTHGRLKSLRQLENAATERIAAYRELLHELSRLELVANGSFFGVADNAIGAAAYHLELQLSPLYDGAVAATLEGALVAVAAIDVTAPFAIDGAAQVRYTIGLACRVAVTFAADATLALDWELPALGFRIPRLPLTGLDLSGIDLPLPHLDFVRPHWLDALSLPIVVNPVNARLAIDSAAGIRFSADRVDIGYSNTLVAAVVNPVVTGSTAMADQVTFQTYNPAPVVFDAPLGLPVHLKADGISLTPSIRVGSQTQLVLAVDIRSMILTEGSGTFLVLSDVSFQLSSKDGLTGFTCKVTDLGTDVTLEIDVRPWLDRTGAAIGRAVQWTMRTAARAAGAEQSLMAKVVTFLRRLVMQPPQLPTVGPVRGVFDGLGALLAKAASQLAVQVIFDAATWRPLRCVISMRPEELDSAQSLTLRTSAFEVGVSTAANAHLALLVEASGPTAGDWFLLAVPDKAVTALPWLQLVLKSDLWLAQNRTTQLAQDGTPEAGQPPAEPLLQLTLTTKDVDAIAIAGVQCGKGRFFQVFNGGQPSDLLTLDTGGKPLIELKASGGLYRMAPIDPTRLQIEAKVAADAARRLLPFLRPPKQATGSSLTHFVSLSKIDFDNAHWSAELTFTLGQGQGKTISAHASLAGEFSIHDWHFTVAAPSAIGFALDGASTFEVLGLSGALTTAGGDAFILDITGEPVLRLGPQTTLQLSPSPGYLFTTDTLSVSRTGIDLDASFKNDKPIRLDGINSHFVFRSASLRIRNSRVDDFQLAGVGSLPAWIGDTKVEVSLQFRFEKEQIRLCAAYAKFEQVGKTIVVKPLRLKLSVSELGMGFREPDGGGAPHYYFLLSGTAEFDPNGAEFDGTLLGYLKEARLELNQCPLTDDVSVLGRHLSFTVPLPKQVSINVFNLFKFEIRSIGFQPDAFGRGDHAIKIGGQVSFSDLGDILDPDIEFHALYLGTPIGSNPLPRVRFDGLRLALRVASSIKVAGTLMAVDGALPMVLRPSGVDPGVTAKGFVGDGSLEIPGLPPLSAALGYLEIEKNGQRAIAWFVYVQANKLTYQITCPIPLYIREIGFGFGYRYTLAALAEADTATSIKHLIERLDEVAKRQGDLARIEAWQPELDTIGKSARFTFAMRALLTMASASPPQKHQWNEEKEKDLPSLFTMDLVAALRSDFTLLMNVRLWLGVNYADFYNGGKEIHEHPLVVGYLYLSGPKQEFLARLASVKDPYIGQHPVIPPLVQRALKAADYSATLYMRPGLLHFEMGWPDQLRWSDSFGPLQVSCIGGFVFRVEDAQVLLGMNFSARGRLALAASAGSDDFGASVSALADIGFTARMIAVIDAARPRGSMYYALIALDIHLEFSARAWLSFEIFRHRVTFEVGFSFGLQVAVALELVLTGDPAIAGRARCYVAINAFGRSLGIQVNLALNGDKVDAARARVARYLDIGLTGPSQLPADPFAGAANAPAAATAAALAIAGADAIGTGAATPGPIQRTLSRVDYYAWCRRVDGSRLVGKASPGYMLVCLVPRAGSTGFYITPPDVDIGNRRFVPREAGDYQVAGLPVGTYCLDGNQWKLTSTDSAIVRIDWNRKLSPDGALLLGMLVANAFVASTDMKQGTVAYADPTPRRYDGVERVDHLTPKERGDIVRRSHLQLGTEQVETPEDRAANDARDFILAQVLDQLTSYCDHADGGSGVVNLGLSLGLCFIVPLPAGDVHPEQIVSTIEVTRLDTGDVGKVTEAPTSLAVYDDAVRIDALEVHQLDDRIEFAWELVRTDDAADLEARLFAYEIVCAIDGDDGLPRNWLVRPCGTIGTKGEGAATVRVTHRAVRQFVDDFSESSLDDGLVQMLRGNAHTALPALDYSICPIADDGSRGRVRSFRVQRQRRMPMPRPLAPTLTVDFAFADARQQEPQQIAAAVVALEWGEQVDSPKAGASLWLVARALPIGFGGCYGNTDDVERRRDLGEDEYRLRRSDMALPLAGDPALMLLRLGDVDLQALTSVLRGARGKSAWRMFVQVRRPEADGTTTLGALVDVGLLVRARVGAGSTPCARVSELEWPFAIAAAGSLIGDIAATTGWLTPKDPPSAAAPANAAPMVQPLADQLSGTWLDIGIGASDPLLPIAGIDIYELRTDEVPPRLLPASLEPSAPEDYARRISRLKLVSPERAALVPAEIGVAAQWEAYYPAAQPTPVAPSTAAPGSAGKFAWSVPQCSSRIVLPRVTPDLLQRLTTTMSDSGNSIFPKKVAIRVTEYTRVTAFDPLNAIEPEWRRLAGVVDMPADGVQVLDCSATDLQSLKRWLSDLRIGTTSTNRRSLEFAYDVDLAPMRADWSAAEIPAAYWTTVHSEYGHPLLIALVESVAEEIAQIVEYPQVVVGKVQGPQGNAPLRATQLIDATPIGADPYGWTALARLGLALSARVYDRRAERYLASNEVQDRIRDHVEHRFFDEPDLAYLAVEVLYRSGRQFRLSDFDGDGGGGGDAAELGDDGLALFQVSLRPRVTAADYDPTVFGQMLGRRDVVLDVPPETIDAWAGRYAMHTLAASTATNVACVVAAKSAADVDAVAPDARGRLQYLLASKDAYARVRGYMARAIGRYDELLQTFGLAPAELDDAAAIPWRNVSTPRSKRVEIPAVLMTRNDRLRVSSAGADPVDVPVWNVVVARHAEQSLSESNAVVALRLGYAGLVVATRRRRRETEWLQVAAAELNRAGAADPVRFDLPEVPPTHLDGDTAVSDLRVAWGASGFDVDAATPPAWPPLWQGAEVLRMIATPYYYQHELLIAARAGIRVSPVNAVPQPMPDVVWPGRQDSVAIEVDAYDDAGEIAVDVEPTRYFDLVDRYSSAAWKEPARSTGRYVGDAPDPDVHYQLDLVGKDAVEPIAHVHVERSGQTAYTALPLTRRYECTPTLIRPATPTPADPFRLRLHLRRAFEATADAPARPDLLPPGISHDGKQLRIACSLDETALTQLAAAYFDGGSLAALHAMERATQSGVDAWEHRFEGVPSGASASAVAEEEFTIDIDPKVGAEDYADWCAQLAASQPWRTRRLRLLLPEVKPTLPWTARVRLPAYTPGTAPNGIALASLGGTGYSYRQGAVGRAVYADLLAAFDKAKADAVRAEYRYRYFGTGTATLALRRWRGN